MTKKDYISLADHIIKHNKRPDIGATSVFHRSHIESLAEFLEVNHRFKRRRWIDYIEGKCGPNGGKR
jgi:hypothetical protein